MISKWKTHLYDDDDDHFKAPKDGFTRSGEHGRHHLRRHKILRAILNFRFLDAVIRRSQEPSHSLRDTYKVSWTIGRVRFLYARCSHGSSIPLLHRRRPTDPDYRLFIDPFILFKSIPPSYTFNGICIFQPCKNISNNKRHSSPSRIHESMLAAVSLIGGAFRSIGYAAVGIAGL